MNSWAGSKDESETPAGVRSNFRKTAAADARAGNGLGWFEEEPSISQRRRWFEEVNSGMCFEPPLLPP